MNGVRSPARVRDISVLHSFHTGSYSVGTGFFSGEGLKRPGFEADHLPPSDAGVKNGAAIPPFPHIPLMTCSIIKHRDNFTVA
jgi:hypothetical protein